MISPSESPHYLSYEHQNSLKIINSETFSQSNSRGRMGSFNISNRGGIQSSGDKFGRDSRRTSLRGIGGGSTPVNRQ